MNIATIAAAIPALRPLWAKSGDRKQKHREKARRPDNKQLLNSPYVIMDQHVEADLHASHLETRITVQGGQNQGVVGSEAGSLPDCTGIMKTTHVSMKNLRKVEGKWISENSSLSDRERRAEDMV